uniref:Uncharacterized protein n=1 Tax=viral metagenome TaxID=1070528 RepID=A0A6M3JUV9_9ZZZZ
MAVRLITTIQRWNGTAADNKPVENVKEGSTFSELDTGRQFVWINKEWIEDLSGPLTVSRAADIADSQRRLLENILSELIAANRARGIDLKEI